MNPIVASVFILTKNEAHNIVRVLASVRDFEDIVVLDSGSTDNTVELARQFTDRVYVKPWLGWSRMSDQAAELCRHDWVLKLDADEEATPELLNEIREALPDQTLSGLCIPFDDRFLSLPNSTWIRKNAKVRFWRKSRGHFGDEYVHEGVHLTGPVREGEGCIIHYGESSISTKLLKNDTYSTLKAQERFDGGRRFSLLALLVAFPLTFLRSYILRRSFCNGIRGFIGSAINALYAFLKEAKLYELELKHGKRKG